MKKNDKKSIEEEAAKMAKECSYDFLLEQGMIFKEEMRDRSVGRQRFTYTDEELRDLVETYRLALKIKSKEQYNRNTQNINKEQVKSDTKNIQSSNGNITKK